MGRKRENPSAALPVAYLIREQGFTLWTRSPRQAIAISQTRSRAVGRPLALVDTDGRSLRVSADAPSGSAAQVPFLGVDR
jgi:hypothetical protein